MLALIGLGAEHARGIGSWAGDRSVALRSGAGSTWSHVRATPLWPGPREAARLCLVDAPAWAFHAVAIAVGLALAGEAALTAARAAVGPETGSALLAIVLPAMLAMLLSMGAVLVGLWRLAAGREDQWPVWLVGLATLALVLT